MGCRDCNVCTRSLVGRVAMIVPKFYYYIFVAWWYSPVKKKCPDCGHWLSSHRRRADGSFKD